MKNEQVAQAWAEGRSAHTRHMSTDGKELYSYGMLIGKTHECGSKLVLDVSGYQAYSVTTSNHVREAYWAARRSDNAAFLIPPVMTANGWREWPSLGVTEVRATGQTWKTHKGAVKAMNKRENKTLFVKSVYGGFSLFFGFFRKSEMDIGKVLEAYNNENAPGHGVGFYS